MRRARSENGLGPWLALAEKHPGDSTLPRGSELVLGYEPKLLDAHLVEWSSRGESGVAHIPSFLQHDPDS